MWKMALPYMELKLKNDQKFDLSVTISILTS